MPYEWKILEIQDGKEEGEDLQNSDGAGDPNLAAQRCQTEVEAHCDV